MTQTNGVSFDSDAKACYDRIVMTLALLASQQLGMQAHVCSWLGKYLSTTKYHIQLPQATSTQSYTNTIQKPLHGPGQGSRAAPGLWVIISSLLMDCMDDNAPGLTMSDPYQKEEICQIMTGFIDDTTHWINTFHHDLDLSLIHI